MGEARPQEALAKNNLHVPTKQKILFLDNYDSFTYNLRQLLAESGVKHALSIVQNDKIQLEEVQHFDKILLSPGAGLPQEAGIMPALITHFAPQKSILGVCLGHQAIAESFGGKLYQLAYPQHGIQAPLHILAPTNPLFRGVRQAGKVGLYHSWAVECESVGKEFDILAEAHEIVMAIQHKSLPIWGVQFHPESIISTIGKKIVRNWLLA
jgi:anthranilate synthase component II